MPRKPGNPAPRVSMTIRLAPDVRDLLVELSNRRGQDMGTIIAALIEEAAKKPPRN